MAIHPSFSRRRRVRTVVGIMAIGLPLAGAVMPASSASAARPMLAEITVEPYGQCNSAGVWVTNTSGSDIEVRLYLDGTPAFVDNPWLPVPDGEGRSGRWRGAGTRKHLRTRPARTCRRGDPVGVGDLRPSGLLRRTSSSRSPMSAPTSR